MVLTLSGVKLRDNDFWFFVPFSIKVKSEKP